MKSQTRIKSEKVLEILFANQYKFRSPDVLRKTVELTQDLVEAGRAKDEKYYLVWYEHLKVAKTLHKAEVRRMLVKNRRMDPSMPFETWNVVASESLDLACSRALKPGDKAKVGEITIAIKLSRPRKEILSEVDARLKHRLHWLEMTGKYQEPITHRPKDDTQLTALHIYQAALDKKIKKLRGQPRRDAIRNYLTERSVKWPTSLGFEDKRFSDYVGDCVKAAKKRISNVAKGKPPNA